MLTGDFGWSRKASLRGGFKLSPTRRPPHALLKDKHFKERKLGKQRCRVQTSLGEGLRNCKNVRMAEQIRIEGDGADEV